MACRAGGVFDQLVEKGFLLDSQVRGHGAQHRDGARGEFERGAHGLPPAQVLELRCRQLEFFHAPSTPVLLLIRIKDKK